MRFSEDEYIYHDENDSLEVAVISVIGDREEQQDCAGAILKDCDALALVCDGMGGQADGKTASNKACDIFLSGFEEENEAGDLHGPGASTEPSGAGRPVAHCRNASQTKRGFPRRYRRQSRRGSAARR